MASFCLNIFNTQGGVTCATQRNATQRNATQRRDISALIDRFCTQFSRQNFFLLIGLLFLFFSGCGRNVPLGGKITYSDDGMPLECGTIAFTNGTMQARGDIGKDGTYNLGTLKVGDGLPPGDYKVYISGAEKIEQGKTPTAQLISRLIDPKYASPETSPLTAKVDDSTKSLNFKVDKAKGKDAVPQER
ncbi:MAG: hypothetical protein LBJ67_16135 [Planctomycetaceae bacterium]|nr:hypothetical protein [Planctomycetaceae bacterium]